MTEPTKDDLFFFILYLFQKKKHKTLIIFSASRKHKSQMLGSFFFNGLFVVYGTMSLTCFEFSYVCCLI